MKNPKYIDKLKPYNDLLDEEINAETKEESSTEMPAVFKTAYIETVKFIRANENLFNRVMEE